MKIYLLFSTIYSTVNRYEKTPHISHLTDSYGRAIKGTGYGMANVKKILTAQGQYFS